jgi:predicted O-methyltransferase YrrM
MEFNFGRWLSETWRSPLRVAGTRDATLERHNLNCDFYSEYPYSDIRNRFFPFPIDSAPSDANKNLLQPKTAINFDLIESCSSISPESVLERYYLLLAYEVVSNEHHLPPIQKCAYLQLLANIYETEVLVETGVLWGTTGLYLKEKFKRIYTIDIDPASCQLARHLFSGTHVEVIEGDSGKIMPSVLSNVHEDALFFLDGHSETDTPVLAELDAIAKHGSKGHVIVIDDLACFSRASGNYPSRQQMQEFVGKLFPEHQLVFEVGFILLLPARKLDYLKSWHARTEGKAMIWPRIAALVANAWEDSERFSTVGGARL